MKMHLKLIKSYSKRKWFQIVCDILYNASEKSELIDFQKRFCIDLLSKITLYMISYNHFCLLINAKYLTGSTQWLRLQTKNRV